MLYGLLNLSFWGYFFTTLVFVQITIAAVTLYLHRSQCHRALDMHPLITHPLRLWLWLTTGMVTKKWVAIHRKHHAKTETAEDPHSPKVMGIKKVLTQGAELYRLESCNNETMEKYGHGTPNDWIENHVYSRYSSKGIYVMLVVDLLLFGVPGITIWAIQMMWIPIFAAGVINGLGHYWGYRNYEVPDASTNLTPIAFFIGGEELHNNHHTYPSSAKFSLKPWEFDIGWMYIRILSFFKLAKVKKLPPKLETSPNKSTVDIDTVKAVINGRFQVMSQYYRQVMLPTLKANKSSVAKKFYLFRRHEALMNEQAKTQLLDILETRQDLKTVYHYRQSLQNVWLRAATSQKELLEALQEWCKQAENSGLETLKDFSAHIKKMVTSAAKNVASHI
jgi:stearoyl-CoA desaturase (delta-9 desaturase)